MKIGKRLIDYIHIKYLFSWIPYNSHVFKAMCAILALITLCVQGIYYMDNPLSVIPIWIMKCYHIINLTHITGYQIENIIYYTILFSMFKSYFIDKKILTTDLISVKA